MAQDDRCYKSLQFLQISLASLKVTPGKMQGGILEVLLVSAEDFKHAHHPLGNSDHYVIIQCGNQTYRSKITSGEDRRAWWNEKIMFNLSSSECRELTHLKLRVMEKEKFLDDRSVGVTMVHLRGVLTEGTYKGHIELKPAPYNIVLEDGTYEGELKIGLKFFSNLTTSMEHICESNIQEVDVEQQIERRGCSAPEKQSNSIYRRIFNLTFRRIPWRRFFFLRKKSNPSDNRKKE